MEMIRAVIGGVGQIPWKTGDSDRTGKRVRATKDSIAQKLWDGHHRKDIARPCA